MSDDTPKSTPCDCDDPGLHAPECPNASCNQRSDDIDAATGSADDRSELGKAVEKFTTLVNVVAVNIRTMERRLIAEGKTVENANAIINMAVARRGVEEEFFVTEDVRG